MSKQPEKKPRSFWPLVNALTAPLAFLIIGYVVWAAINAKPRVVPVASAPTFTVIDLNQNSDDSNTPTEPTSADDTDTPEEGASDGSESKEPVAVPDSKKIPESGESQESVTESKEKATPPDVAEESARDPDLKVEPKPESPIKPKVVLGPAPNFYNVDVAKFLFEKKCSECHKLKRVENHSFADVTAVEGLIDKMVENGLEVNEKERSFLDYYVQSTFVD